MLQLWFYLLIRNGKRPGKNKTITQYLRKLLLAHIKFLAQTEIVCINKI